MEKIISVYFVFNYVLRLVLADFPLQKAREMMMIIYLCTTLSVFIDFLESVGSERYDSYLCLLDILRVLRIARMHHLEAYIDSEIVRACFRVVFTIVLLLFGTAGVVQNVENIVFCVTQSLVKTCLTEEP